MSTNLHELRSGLEKGFIDKTLLANLQFVPELLVNDKSRDKKVLSTILSQLQTCDEFWFSVAFVTRSGVATLMNAFIDLAERKVKGKILVSQYLNFSEPEALRKLRSFDNIELKIATHGKYHSKGYLFTSGKIVNLIIGSSNFTAGALCVNKEWNLKVTAAPDSHIICSAIEEFTREFESAVAVTEEFIVDYQKVYLHQRAASRIQIDFLEKIGDIVFSPNQMQRVALDNLQALRREGKDKALLISATGTGKTFLSAFDVQKFNPERFLFVVHRANIAHAAMRTFGHVFGDSKSMGLYSGNRKEIEKPFLFSTIQTISQKQHLEKFDPEHFDYIVVDESHHASADSYQLLLNYFSPKFLLGMTATPERTNGEDIFKLFDHNVAYEIRLHHAMEEEMLSPFHYYGVTDLSVNGKILEEKADFKKLVASERVDRIIEKIELYGCDDGIIRGLIFCSGVEECKDLSAQFNSRGYKTLALSGMNNDEERANAINRLESDGDDKLDYLFTVDIFNEGIDIPRVNQVVMLRPTQSAIVFVQQLGRGLRKTEDKKYLTVIDFIGNYDNNYMVPIALYGDTTYNKDTLRKLMSQGSAPIPGTSTINFDKIAKEKIYAAIDSAKLQLKQDLVNDYRMLKFRLGRIPKMIDFLVHESRDPFHYVKYSKSYYGFVATVENNIKYGLSKKDIKVLELISSEIANSKRVEEVVLLEELLRNPSISLKRFSKLIFERYNSKVDQEVIDSCIRGLNFTFVKKQMNIVENDGNKVALHPYFRKLILNETFLEFLKDTLAYGRMMFEKRIKEGAFVNGFVVGQKYSRKDVFRILNYDFNPNPQNVGGYFIRPDKTKFPIFVTYNKKDHISESIKYSDEFVNPTLFSWETKGKRYLKSPEVRLLQANPNNLRILLFVQKSNDEGIEFYYLSDVKPVEGSIEEVRKPGKGGNVVKVDFVLDNPVELNLYNYITGSEGLTSTKLDNNKALPNAKHVHVIRMLDENSVVPFTNCIPVYNVKVAAGDFAQNESNEILGWVELPKKSMDPREYFVCQVIGNSMNKRIPSNSWCLFKRNPVGSRNGKIVLAKHRKIQDDDYGSGFTIKFYESSKSTTEELWEHETIVLSPRSTDSKYEKIVLQIDDYSEFSVIGEFISVLD